jgi:hypothetical protein
MCQDADCTRRDFVRLTAATDLAAAAGATHPSQAAGPPEKTAATLQAGTAKRDITPEKPVALAGYASRKNLSQGVHDPLSARAVVFQQNRKRLVFLSTDIVGFYGGTAASIREAILAACDLQPSELFLAAIHTHSAPNPTLGGKGAHPNNVEYTKTLETQLVAAAREALGHMAAVEVAVGSGSSPVGANRREFVRDRTGRTTVQLGRNPSVLTDREVQVLRVAHAEKGELAAVVWAYATHSTSLGPGNYLVSGDVHGLAEQFVEQQLASGVIAPAFAGASGDIDPWFRVLPKFNTAKGWIPEPVLLGTMLGEEVLHVLDGMKKPAAGGPINTAFKTLHLPRKSRKVDGSRDEDLPEFNLTVGRLGNVAFVGLGGEVFNEVGKAIKAASPFPHTFILTHCNGTAGYLPTKGAYPEGGYEVASSQFAPTAAEEVVQEAVRMLRDL